MNACVAQVVQVPFAPTSSSTNAVTIELTAVLVAVTDEEPRVLTIHDAAALPSGPFESAHRSCRQACVPGSSAKPIIPSVMSSSSTHLRTATALTRGRRAAGVDQLSRSHTGRSGLRQARIRLGRAGIATSPGRTRRGGAPAMVTRVIGPRLRALGMLRPTAASVASAERVDSRSGSLAAPWNEELVLQRYELLYEAGLVAEAARRVLCRRGMLRGRRCGMIIAAFSPPASRGCGPRSSTGPWCSS